VVPLVVAVVVVVAVAEAVAFTSQQKLPSILPTGKGIYQKKVLSNLILKVKLNRKSNSTRDVEFCMPLHVQ